MDYHMQFLKFLSLLQNHGISYAIYEISFPSPKMWFIICNFWNFSLFSKNVDNHMQSFWISFPFPKTWTIICNFWNFFIFSKNVDYHMQFLEFLSLLQKHRLSYAILKFLSLLQKRGQSYAIYEITFPSPKTCTIFCNF